MPQGMQFPCPYCQAPVVAPGGLWSPEQAAAYQQQMMTEGAALAAQAANAYEQQHNPGAAHFAAGADTVATLLPSGEMIAMGAQVQADRTWLMKAVDLQTQQTRWEVLHGMPWNVPPSRMQMAVRGASLYIAHHGQLISIDLASGQLRWQMPLPDQVQTNCDLLDSPDELMLFDLDPRQPQGTIVLATQLGILVAYDRNSGQNLWTSPYGEGLKISPVEGVGVLLRKETEFGFVGRDGTPLTRWANPQCEDVCDLGGRIALLLNDLGDDGDTSAVAFHDPTTGQTSAPHLVPDVEFGPDPALVAGKVFCSVCNGTPGLYHVVDPQAAPTAPKAGFFSKLFGGKGDPGHKNLNVGAYRIEHIRAAGPLVVFQLTAFEGGDTDRIVALDAATLALRFDSGVLPEEPSNMSAAHIQVGEGVFVYVTSPTNDDQQCELRAVDTATGAQRWVAPIGAWTHHFIAGDKVIAYGDDQAMQILDLATGTRLAAYPVQS